MHRLFLGQYLGSYLVEGVILSCLGVTCTKLVVWCGLAQWQGHGVGTQGVAVVLYIGGLWQGWAIRYMCCTCM